MHPVIWIVLIIVFALVGAAIGYGYRKSMVEKKINRSEETARRLYDDAVRKADDYKKEKVEKVIKKMKSKYMKDGKALLKDVGSDFKFTKAEEF